MGLVKFVEDHPAPPGQPYWAGVYQGISEYLILISERKIIGVVTRPYHLPGYGVRRDIALREAAERGYKDVATTIGYAIDGVFFLRVREDAKLLPTKWYYVPSVLGGYELRIEVLEE